MHGAREKRDGGGGGGIPSSRTGGILNPKRGNCRWSYWRVGGERMEHTEDTHCDNGKDDLEDEQKETGEEDSEGGFHLHVQVVNAFTV